MKNVLPKYLVANLSVNDLVNYGNTPDSSSESEEKVREVIVEKLIEPPPKETSE